MEHVPIEIKYKIANFLTLESAKNLSITSSIWRNATYNRIWNKPRLRKIALKDLKNLADHPIFELHTSDISEPQLGFKNLVQVLKKFQSLQLLIVNHFGYADNIQTLKELDCKLKIYFDKLKIKNMGVQKAILVLEMINPEAVYFEGEHLTKNLTPSDILSMRNINLQTLSTFHLAAKYYTCPWPELKEIKTLKKFRLVSGSYFSEKHLEMFNITYVQVPHFYTSRYKEPWDKEHIAVIVESLIIFGIIRYIKMGLYLVLWDVVLYIENE